MKGLLQGCNQALFLCLKISCIRRVIEGWIDRYSVRAASHLTWLLRYSDTDYLPCNNCSSAS